MNLPAEPEDVGTIAWMHRGACGNLRCYGQIDTELENISLSQCSTVIIEMEYLTP